MKNIFLKKQTYASETLFKYHKSLPEKVKNISKKLYHKNQL